MVKNEPAPAPEEAGSYIAGIHKSSRRVRSGRSGSGSSGSRPFCYIELVSTCAWILYPLLHLDIPPAGCLVYPIAPPSSRPPHLDPSLVLARSFPNFFPRSFPSLFPTIAHSRSFPPLEPLGPLSLFPSLLSLTSSLRTGASPARAARETDGLVG